MKIDVNNYKELFNQLINGGEIYVYMYNKNELIGTCHNKDINDITIYDFKDYKKLVVIINSHVIIQCDEIRF